MRKFSLQLCGNFKETYEEDLTIFKTVSGRMWTFVGLVILFGIVPLLGGPRLFHPLNVVGAYAAAAIGLNLLVSCTGQISLAHGALFGVGAYTAGTMVFTWGIPLVAALPAAGVTAAAVGTVLIFPSLHLRTGYLTLATLAGQIVMGYLFGLWEGSGPAPSIQAPADSRSSYFVVGLTNASLVWLTFNLMRSRYGRAFVAVRVDKKAAEGRGIPLFGYGLISVALGSFCAGVGGALLVGFIRGPEPHIFGLWSSVEFVAMILIGGLGRIKGAYFGAIFFVILTGLIALADPWLKPYAHVISSDSLREILLGIFLILFTFFLPEGLAGIWERMRRKLKTWPFLPKHP